MTDQPHNFEFLPDAAGLVVVLVEPSENRNIGAVARCMANFGVTDLRLVAPPSLDLSIARITGRHGETVLDNHRVFATLADAIQDCEEVVGLGAQGGSNRLGRMTLPEFINAHPPQSFVGKRTALVFGPEATGLRLEHIEHLRYLVRIPMHPGYESMNLSHAVAVILYELTKFAPAPASQESLEKRPPFAAFHQLDRMVHEVLEKVGFYRVSTSPRIPGIVQGLLRRLDPSERELSIILGMFHRINLTLNGQTPKRDKET